MAEIVMPRLSDTMEEGTILRWLKRDGEPLARGEELVEIETDKATMTYESDQDGVLADPRRRGRHARRRRADRPCRRLRWSRRGRARGRYGRPSRGGALVAAAPRREGASRGGRRRRWSAGGAKRGRRARGSPGGR